MIKIEKDYLFKNDKNKLISRAKRFFLASGFKLINESDEQLTLATGNLFRNLFEDNVIKWKSHITVKFSVLNQGDVAVGLLYELSSFGQIVTDLERTTLDEFMAGFAEAMKDENEAIINEIESANSTSAKLKQFGYSVLFVIIASIILGTASALSEIYKFNFTITASSMGAIVGFLYVWKKKTK